MLTHEQQLLVPVRQVGQVEGTAHGKLPLRVGGQPQQWLPGPLAEVDGDRLARHEVLARETHRRVGRGCVGVEDDPWGKPLDVETD